MTIEAHGVIKIISGKLGLRTCQTYKTRGSVKLTHLDPIKRRTSKLMRATSLINMSSVLWVCVPRER